MKLLKTLTKFEWMLWSVSLTTVTVSFFWGGNLQPLTLVASLIGVTALIFVAKGQVAGQVLTVVFSLCYAVVSWQLRYYGEMITYLGMTAPIAALSVVSWLKNPFEKGKNEVRVAQLSAEQLIKAVGLSLLVTGGFYFILRGFHTPNLPVATLSVTTSFLASYLMFCRSPYYALAYAANDLVLIVLWMAATLQSTAYLPMVLCFVLFLCNDIYGFISWHKRKQAQAVFSEQHTSYQKKGTLQG